MSALTPASVYLTRYETPEKPMHNVYEIEHEQQTLNRSCQEICFPVQRMT